MSQELIPLGTDPSQLDASGKRDNCRLAALCAFLKDPINSRTRERIFFHRLFYDLKLAAAYRGYHLGLFEPDVDRDGFDVVLDDRDQVRQLQLKSVMGDAKTGSWETTLRFLRPLIFKTGLEMGFPQSPPERAKRAELYCNALIIVPSIAQSVIIIRMFTFSARCP